ncbi:MAG: 2-C-methyl-D-erythritol 4-phosphate cytidylyltransferase [Desulfovibrionaceae bacterium]
MRHIWSIILAAGSSTRLKDAAGGERKQYLLLEGAPLYCRSMRTLAALPEMRGLVLVFPPSEVEERGREALELAARYSLGVPVRVAAGGSRRQDSVRAGLAALPPECGAVLVHDGARPFASAVLAARVADALRAGAAGVVPALPVTDTIKEIRPGEAGAVIERTLDRARLAAVQTPQGFDRALLAEAHERAEAEGWDVTDDASLLERLARPGAEVLTVPGEETNRKITTPGDLELLAPKEPHGGALPVAGWGYDVHRYGGERPLVLGGVLIPGPVTVAAHSDGDVLLHALVDAILGTFGGGDIGALFPDTDPAFAGMESGIFVQEALRLAGQAGVEVIHADLTIVAQVPKIGPHRESIARNVAALLSLPAARVNVKATTEEGLGFTGEKKGIKAVACVSALVRPLRAGEAG